MKVLQNSAGALSNFEVLDLLRSRGAGRDPTRAITSVSRSEFKVYDYLEKSVACIQTREVIENFADECKKFDLAKAEILNIVNIRPTGEPLLNSLIEECESRYAEEMVRELLETILHFLPHHPSQENKEEEKTEPIIAEGEEGEEETEPEPNTTS